MINNIKIWHKFGIAPLTVAMLSLLVFGMSQQAMAASWDAGIADWFTAANWNTNRVPTAAESTSIDNGGTAQVGVARSKTHDWQQWHQQPGHQRGRHAQ